VKEIYMDINSLISGPQNLGLSKCKYLKTYFCKTGQIIALYIEAIGGSI
jgi:hypothetical protein